MVTLDAIEMKIEATNTIHMGSSSRLVLSRAGEGADEMVPWLMWMLVAKAVKSLAFVVVIHTCWKGGEALW